MYWSYNFLQGHKFLQFTVWAMWLQGVNRWLHPRLEGSLAPDLAPATQISTLEGTHEFHPCRVRSAAGSGAEYHPQSQGRLGFVICQKYNWYSYRPSASSISSSSHTFKIYFNIPVNNVEIVKVKTSLQTCWGLVLKSVSSWQRNVIVATHSQSSEETRTPATG